MIKVDWSEAPEGATHWEPRGIAAEGWMRLADDGWYFWKACVGAGWQACNPNSNRISRMIARPPVDAAWDGKGLPPVGTRCLTPHEGEDIEVEILAHAKHGTHDAVLAAKVTSGAIGEMFGWLANMCEFRPILTPEQIAAAEREAAIDDMQVITDAAGMNVHAKLAALYDAGYRKQHASHRELLACLEDLLQSSFPPCGRDCEDLAQRYRDVSHAAQAMIEKHRQQVKP